MPAQYGNVWGNAASQLMDVTCPSGNLAQIRKPGITGLMSAGILGDLDMLTGIVDKKFVAPNTGAKGKQAKQASRDESVLNLLKDPKKLEAIQRVCCKVAAHIVVQPTVRLHFVEVQDPRDGKSIYTDLPETERNREPSLEYPENPVIYTDEIDFEDAMFLFQLAVGGTKDLESFRKRLDESVAGVESLEDLPAPS